LTDRGARILLGVVAALLVAAVWRVELTQFWGDGATYHAMAWSLAEDGDLRYEAKDVFRVRREFPTGPQGIFLKRASGGLRWDGAGGFPWVRRVGPDEPRIYYAKPFAYSVAAAPLVKLFGTRGLLLANALFLAAALFLGYAALRRSAAPAPALAFTLALFLATAAPVYLVWPTPEIFNLALTAAGLAAWRLDRPLLSAVILGVATYSKPYNLWLAIPLGLEPLLGGGAASAWARRLLESTRRGLVLVAVILACFGLNAAVTGEANYQGGAERKTFYGTFPFEWDAERQRETTFGNSGIWMSTNQLGPRVEGRDEVAASQGAEPPRSGREIRDSFLWNLLYFWIGRFGGALPYFFPMVLALALFLAVGPRSRAGALALCALGVSYLFYIAMIPDNWYGGPTVGNRYFLNLLPLGLFLVPRGREMLAAIVGTLASAALVLPLLLAPLYHSFNPGVHAARGAFRLFPAELTMLNDLAAFTPEAWRKKRPYGDTEGDAHRGWPADPKAYYLYFPDDATYGKESLDGVEGFWVRGRSQGEVFLRALEPVRRMGIRVTGGETGDQIQFRVGSHRLSVEAGVNETRAGVIEPGRGFVYKDSFVYVLRLRSERGAPRAAFVSIALDVVPRPLRQRLGLGRPAPQHLEDEGSLLGVPHLEDDGRAREGRAREERGDEEGKAARGPEHGGEGTRGQHRPEEERQPLDAVAVQGDGQGAEEEVRSLRDQGGPRGALVAVSGDP
jgi:hypothetical protein